MSGFFHRISDGPADERRNRRPLDGKTRAKLVLSYLPDWIITIGLIVLVTLLTNHEGFKREFSLTDTSIQHTFATKERVPFQMAIVYAGAIPAGLIILISVFWRRSFFDLHNGLLGLVLSLAITTAITDIVKVTVGRPRPDLIDRCQPLAGVVNAFPFGLANVTICTVLPGNIINDGFKSFPSGHSSFSFAGLGFLSLYLAGKMHLFDMRGHAIKAWICIIPLMGASLIAISRAMDYRHHPTDLLIGGLLGLIMSIFTYSLYYPPLNSSQSHLPYSPRFNPTGAALPPPATAPSASSGPGDGYASYEEDLPLGTASRNNNGYGWEREEERYQEVAGDDGGRK